MELSEFLAARLAEEEAAAKAAANRHWLTDDNTITLHPEQDGDGFISFPTRADAQHAANWDPARVLREVEAKRLIVKLHDREHDCPVIVPVAHPEAFAEGMYVSTEHVDGEDPDVSPCTTLRQLAAVWSDHPDYDPAWR